MTTYVEKTPETHRQSMAKTAEQYRGEGRSLVYVDVKGMHALNTRGGKIYYGTLYDYKELKDFHFTVQEDGAIVLELHVYVPTLERSYRLRKAKLTPAYEKLIRDAIPVYEASDKTIYVEM